MKNQIMYRFVSLFTCVILALSVVGNTHVVAADTTESFASDASGTDAIVEAIVEVLTYMEPEKASFGLENVDFELLNVGPEIPVYECINDEVVVSNVRCFPLIEMESIVVLAWVLADGSGDVTASVSTIILELAAKENISSDEILGIIYDANGINVIFPGGTTLVYQTCEELGRDVLSCDTSVAIKQTENALTPLNYKSNHASNATSYSLAVSFVSQEIGTNIDTQICWAASVACIGNYLRNSECSAIAVAQELYGSNYNKSASIDAAIATLNTFYKQDYSCVGIPITEAKVAQFLKAGYPIYAVFEAEQITHATVIYGVDTLRGYCSIMDPYFSTADTDGSMTTGSLRYYGDYLTYSYYNEFENITMYVVQYACDDDTIKG